MFAQRKDLNFIIICACYIFLRLWVVLSNLLVSNCDRLAEQLPELERKMNRKIKHENKAVKNVSKSK